MRTCGVQPEIEGFDLPHFHQAEAMRRDARLAPDTDWRDAGIGRHQITQNEWWPMAIDGYARSGLEDNVRPDHDWLALSNAALLRRVVDLCDLNSSPSRPRIRREKISGRSGFRQHL